MNAPEEKNYNCAPEGSPSRPFVMTESPSAEAALRHWLREKKYNNWLFGKRDVKGNLMIGLQYDRNLESGYSKNASKRGLILCRTPIAFEKALEMVKRYGSE